MYIVLLTSLPYPTFLPMARSHRQKELSHRKRGCRWQSDVTIGNLPSVKFSSENTCLPMAKAEAIGKRVADGRYPHRQTLHVIRPAVRLTAGLPMADATWPSTNSPVFRWPGPSAFFLFCFLKIISRIFLPLATAIGIPGPCWANFHRFADG